VLTDISEERIASIFRVENKKKSASEPARAGATDGFLNRFWIFQNMVLRRIFGAQRDDVTRGWGKLRNELYNL
jgi:hypothetical protein